MMKIIAAALISVSIAAIGTQAFAEPEYKCNIDRCPLK